MVDEAETKEAIKKACGDPVCRGLASGVPDELRELKYLRQKYGSKSRTGYEDQIGHPPVTTHKKKNRRNLEPRSMIVASNCNSHNQNHPILLRKGQDFQTRWGYIHTETGSTARDGQVVGPHLVRYIASTTGSLQLRGW